MPNGDIFWYLKVHHLNAKLSVQPSPVRYAFDTHPQKSGATIRATASSTAVAAAYHRKSER